MSKDKTNPLMYLTRILDAISKESEPPPACQKIALHAGNAERGVLMVRVWVRREHLVSVPLSARDCEDRTEKEVVELLKVRLSEAVANL